MNHARLSADTSRREMERLTGISAAQDRSAIVRFVRGPQIVMERLAAYIEGRMDAGDLRADDPVQAAMHLIQIAQTQQNLRLWGIVDIPAVDQIHGHAVRALDLFNRAYAR